MNLKKVLAIGIALSIVTGSSVSAFTSSGIIGPQSKELKEKIMVLESQLATDGNLKKVKDSDKVRVIVEVEGDAVIEKATAKGLKVSEMNTSEVESLQKKILKEQTSIQQKINNKGINFKLINSFTNVANGFSMETTLGEAKKIQGIKGVKSVTIANEYERPEPYMNSSGDITQTVPTWNLGYNGEGTVISIIDTGIDPSHKDMVLTNPENAELQSDEVEVIAGEKNLPGYYRTAKVPYGYNYMDENDQILDLGPGASEHGMHVAGISAANGDVENGGIKGTAPEAQLLAMKVFGNNPEMPSTFGDVIIKAIDDSVILGADVINMSLGSTAAFVDDNDPEQAAVNRAVANGVVTSISAGNSNVLGNGWQIPFPFAENPDYGVVGAPGLATDSLQVASIENNKVSGCGVEFTIDGESYIYPYTTAGADILTVLKGEQLEVVDCGTGDMSKVTEEIAGKVALIQRGGDVPDLTQKVSNAQAAGAIAAIVYNHEEGGDALINMAYPEGGEIPAVFIGLTAGNLIKENLSKEGFTVSFNGSAAQADNVAAGKMSTFTSWGVTPSLDMKPEITGVGGNVWSTAQNNRYQNMSGTSMAAPNVSGGAALVLQRVDKEFGLKGEARAKMAKKIMMSTAVPHKDKGVNQAEIFIAGENYTSPRRQGAGVMDLYAAASTPAVVTDSKTDECKVNLKEIKGDKASFTVNIKNFSNEELTYVVDGTVQTDLNFEGFTLLEAQNIVNADGKFPISFSAKEVKVPANGSANLTVNIDLANAKNVFGESIEEAFVNGGYVEGFITLTDPSDNNPQLSIPYMGFKGDWGKAPALDASIYDTERDTFYGYTSIASEVGDGNYDLLGIDLSGENVDGNKVAFSPNGDGQYDTVAPVISLLRNLKELDVEVVDSNGKVIRTLTKEVDQRKHYFDGRYTPFTILETATWDGKANNKLVADGDYTLRVKGKLDYEGADWQNFDFKVKVDTVAPTVDAGDVSYDKATGDITIVAKDGNGGHVYKYALFNEGKLVEENSTGKFNLAGMDMTKVTLEVYDYARNKAVIDVSTIINGVQKEPIGPAEGDITIPTVSVKAPEFFGVLNSSKVEVKGTIKDESSIDEFKINGKEVPFKFNTNTGLWEFKTEVELEDGYHSIKVYAKDSAGNVSEFAHKVFIDTTAPVIDVKVPEETDKDKIEISGLITDNMPSLRVKVNGSVVKTIAPDWSYFDKLEPASYDLAYEVELVDGENVIIVEASDDAGNTTTREFVVNKVDEIVEPEKDTTPPAAPIVTEEDGLVTIKAADEDTVKLEYSLDNRIWVPYTEPVEVAEKATIYARAIDEANNISKVTELRVPDRTAPKAPKLSAKNNLVTIKANEKDDDVAKLEYSFDKKTWIEYKEPVKLAAKKTIYARAIDEAGNISEISKFTMPSSGNSLPQTGALVGSGLLALGGVVAAVFGTVMLKKKNKNQ